jgi:Spy/CpxP family protein refolding chaperone
MSIVLTPKQKAAVQTKAQEIRELWDGIREVTTDVTGTEEGRA